MPPADTDLTQRNRETVQRFCEIICNEHKTAAAVDFIQDDYSQHSPFLAHGRQPFIDYFSDLFAEYPRARLHVKRIIAEGDYVVVHSHFERDPADRGTAPLRISFVLTTAAWLSTGTSSRKSRRGRRTKTRCSRPILCLQRGLNSACG